MIALFDPVTTITRAAYGFSQIVHTDEGARVQPTAVNSGNPSSPRSS
jgi:hypothetical protein